MNDQSKFHRDAAATAERGTDYYNTLREEMDDRRFEKLIMIRLVKAAIVLLAGGLLILLNS